MTIDINNDWVTDRRAKDLINRFSNDVQSIKDETLEEFLDICESKSITEDIIPVDDDNYPTTRQLKSLLRRLYTYYWFLNHYSDGNEIDDAYRDKMWKYEKMYQKSAAKLKIEHVLGTQDALSYVKAVTITSL